MKMKLLEWTQDKHQHNPKEPFKDLNIGNHCICLSSQPSLEDQDWYKRTTFGSGYRHIPLNASKQKQEESLSPFEANIESIIDSELFHGFLTIGNQCSEPKGSKEPETPAFGTPLESITERKTEVTEDELKLVNHELEKLVEVESNEAGYDESSARDSYVSIITLNGNRKEGTEEVETNQNTMVCPLPGYLLGPEIELRETKTDMKKERSSLAELFCITENCSRNCEAEEVQAKPKHNSAMYFVRKMIKRVYASSKSSPPYSGGLNTDSLPTKKKKSSLTDTIPSNNNLAKVLHMLHRKAHPERSVVARDSVLLKKGMVENTPTDGCTNENSMQLNGENTRFIKEAASKERMQSYKSNMNLLQHDQSCSNFRENEHWIRTDTDFLVLDLEGKKVVRKGV